MSNSRLLMIFLILGFLVTSACWSQSDKELHKKLVLVRAPEYDETCTKSDKNKALSLGSEHVSIELGERFHIVTHRSGFLEATVIGKCEPSTYFDEGLFIFSSTQAIDWMGDTDALLAIKSANLSSDQAGSVARIRLSNSQRMTVLNALKEQVPLTDTIIIQDGMIVSPPKSSRRYLFVTAEHYDPKNYLTAGDKAINPKGQLFEIHGSELSFLVSESYLTRVFSISDIDNDGIWEMLVHSGGWGGGSYELRFFDGSTFQKEKLDLYEWSH